MAIKSKLILGTVQFGLNYGINNFTGKPSKLEINKILNYAFDSGIRFLDTAEVYGNSHLIIGDFHKNHPKKYFKIITKLPNKIDQNIEKKIIDYLEELQVKKLEALLFHSFLSYKSNLKNLKNLIELKSSKIIKYIGVSIYTNEEFNKVIDDDNIDLIQLPFNLLDNNNIRGELIAKAKSKNKIIHTRSSYLQGLFFLQDNKKNKITEALSDPLNKIKYLSNETKLSIQKIALSYCLSQKNIDFVIIGVDNVEQLKLSVNTTKSMLNKDVVDCINSITIENTDLLNPSKWNI